MTRMLVTISPPTPNGDLHLGHLSGPFLSADVFVRAQRMLGHEALFLSYSDDYQSYLARKALERGREPGALALENAGIIEDTLRQADIHLDHFMRAWDNPYFIRAVTLFYRQAVARGVVGCKPHRVPYCEHCSVYGYEAFARGRCDNCGASSDASQCEACAHSPDVARMGEMTCILCKRPMGWREVEREYLRLGGYRKELSALYDGRPLRIPLRNFIERVSSRGEFDWFITRPHECGIPVPGEQSKIIHTWFSGMPGYYAATEEYGALHGSPGATDRYWRAPDARIVHFLGFDCSFSHAIAYPTLASNFPDFTRNLHLYTNAFLKLNGGDFSTSRGHAIWIRDMLKETSSDSLRTYIAGVAPEESTENFAVADFRGWKSQHYEEATARLLEAATAARARQSQAGAAAADVELASAMRRSWHGAMDLERYSMKALAVLLHEFRSQVLERLRVGAEVSAGLVAAYAVLGEPLHPGLSAQLYERLAIDRETLRGWLRQHDAQLPGVPARAEEAHVLQADRRASHGDTMAVRG